MTSFAEPRDGQLLGVRGASAAVLAGVERDSDRDGGTGAGPLGFGHGDGPSPGTYCAAGFCPCARARLQLRGGGTIKISR